MASHQADLAGAGDVQISLDEDIRVTENDGQRIFIEVDDYRNSTQDARALQNKKLNKINTHIFHFGKSEMHSLSIDWKMTVSHK